MEKRSSDEPEFLCNNRFMAETNQTITVPVQVKPTKAPRRRRLGRALLIAFLVVLVGFGGLFGYVTRTYAHGILPNTTINGMDVSGLTAEAAQSLIQRDLLPQHQVSLTVGDTILQPTATDLGISYPTREVVTEAYGYGHETSWTTRVVSTLSALFTHRQYELSPQVDTAALKTYVDNIVQTNLKEASNATLVYNGGAVDLQTAAAGQAVDGTRLYQDLLKAAAGDIEGYDVTAQVAVVVPSVTDEALTAWRDRLVKLSAVNVTLTAADKSIAASKEQKLSWFALSQSSGGYSIAVNNAAVKSTVTALAKKLNKAVINDQVDSAGNVVTAGQDGYNVDVDATTAALLPQLQAMVTADAAGQTPAAVQLASTTTTVTKQQTKILANSDGVQVAPAIDTAAKFAQISLANQKMYLFENHQLINVFTVSTGKKGYETPRGVHQIYSKSVRAWSRTYSLFMPYWNAITADGQYGIHDLPEWPSGYKETEAHLGTPVSHGCIRLGTTNAKYFFEWAPVGMAVVVQ